jgi:hypothetical protein
VYAEQHTKLQHGSLDRGTSGFAHFWVSPDAAFSVWKDMAALVYTAASSVISHWCGELGALPVLA